MNRDHFGLIALSIAALSGLPTTAAPQRAAEASPDLSRSDPRVARLLIGVAGKLQAFEEQRPTPPSAPVLRPQGPASEVLRPKKSTAAVIVRTAPVVVQTRKLPDLQITAVDLSGNQVTIKNCGTAPVTADQFIYVSWSEASYTKPGWNSSSYVPTTGALLPGSSVVFSGLWGDVDGNGLDARTRFCVDADGTIPELDECNNSVDGSGRLLGVGAR